MPDIGLLEMVVIGLVLFIVVGPERMPELFAQVTDFIQKAKSWIEDARRMLASQAQELKDPVLQAKEVVREELETATDDVTGDINKELREIRESGEAMKQASSSEALAKTQEQESSEVMSRVKKDDRES